MNGYPPTARGSVILLLLKRRELPVSEVLCRSNHFVLLRVGFFFIAWKIYFLFYFRLTSDFRDIRGFEHSDEKKVDFRTCPRT